MRQESKTTSATAKLTVLTPIDTGQPPPRLSRKFPHNEKSAVSPWTYAIEQQLVTDQLTRVAHLPTTTHMIVDGDTLKSLAKRYFDDESCARDIFEANRHLLSNPEALPIGVELVIPSGDHLLRRSRGAVSDKPLMPVVPASN